MRWTIRGIDHIDQSINQSIDQSLIMNDPIWYRWWWWWLIKKVRCLLMLMLFDYCKSQTVIFRKKIIEFRYESRLIFVDQMMMMMMKKIKDWPNRLIFFFNETMKKLNIEKKRNRVQSWFLLLMIMMDQWLVPLMKMVLMYQCVWITIFRWEKNKINKKKEDNQSSSSTMMMIINWK